MPRLKLNGPKASSSKAATSEEIASKQATPEVTTDSPVITIKPKDLQNLIELQKVVDKTIKDVINSIQQLTHTLRPDLAYYHPESNTRSDVHVTKKRDELEAALVLSHFHKEALNEGDNEEENARMINDFINKVNGDRPKKEKGKERSSGSSVQEGRVTRSVRAKSVPRVSQVSSQRAWIARY